MCAAGPAGRLRDPRLSQDDAMSRSEGDDPAHDRRKATRCRARMGMAPTMAPERRRDVVFGWGWRAPWHPKGDAMSPSDGDSPDHGPRKATRCRLGIAITAREAAHADVCGWARRPPPGSAPVARRRDVAFGRG